MTSPEVASEFARARRGGRAPWLPAHIAKDPIRSAHQAGLEYVTDDMPGIRRVRRGRGFSYIGLDGRPVRDPDELARIRSLAIPPAWSEVWICPLPDGHLQATGRDTKGRKQYRYHPSWGEQRSHTKYDRMQIFGRALPAIRQRVDHDLSLRGLSRERVLATVLRLMELTYIRVGNKEYARANKSFGLTTLRDRHVQISGAEIHLRFNGKSGQQHEIDVRDRRLARIVKQCRDIPGYDLFQYYDENGVRQVIASGDVNAYLYEITGQAFTAKDFRTWGGTVLAARELRQMAAADARKRQRSVAQAIRKVANQLGNRPATCRKYYVHPAIVDAFLDGSLVTTFERFDEMPSEELPQGLSAEEAAVLALLVDRPPDDISDGNGDAGGATSPDGKR